MVKTVKTSSAKPTKTVKKTKNTTTVKNTKKTEKSAATVRVSKKYTNMFAAYRIYWKRGFDWFGTSSRSEYWWAVLANILILLGGLFFGLLLGSAIIGWGISSASPALATIGYLWGGLWIFALIVYGLATIVPTIALIVRRLHDAGLPAWLVVLYFIAVFGDTVLKHGGQIVSFVAGVVLFILMLLPTRVENNPHHQFNQE